MSDEEKMKPTEREDEMKIAELRQISKYYEMNEDCVVKALDSVNLTIGKGKFQAIVGTSGSGKSTLLHVLGGLDYASEGNVCFFPEDDTSKGFNLTDMTNDELTKFRRKHIGFIFQNYNLVPMLTVMENIIFPLQLDEQEISLDFVEEIIHKLDISDQKDKYPNQLSGGQQQRVSIARALVLRPDIILADEPTGNLDQKNSRQVIALLRDSAKEYKQTIVMVTHDEGIAQECDRRIYIEDGQTIRDEWNGNA